MKCNSCGATMRYDVASYGCVCDSCGNIRRLHRPEEGLVVGEFDFNAAIAKAPSEWGIARKIVTCKNCGAVLLNDSDQMSGLCPFCGSNIVLADAENCGIAPTAIIPFSTTKEQVIENYYKWNKFAIWSPEKFRKGKFLGDLVGLYVPYWVFDADTVTTYVGEFGYDHDVGDSVRTDWYTRSGIIEKHIDDFSVCASRKFSQDKMLNQVIRFEERELVPYTPDALAGFSAEKYTIGINEAWNMGKVSGIKSKLEYAIRTNERADRVRKLQYSTEYTNVRYKYVLVPAWLTASVYNGQVYNVVASGHNNRGNCNRPVSVAKIILIVLAILGIFSLPSILYFLMVVIQALGSH